MASDVSGDFKRILVSLITAHREADGAVDQAKAKTDAKVQYNIPDTNINWPRGSVLVEIFKEFIIFKNLAAWYNPFQLTWNIAITNRNCKINHANCRRPAHAIQKHLCGHYFVFC